MPCRQGSRNTATPPGLSQRRAFVRSVVGSASRLSAPRPNTRSRLAISKCRASLTAVSKDQRGAALGDLGQMRKCRRGGFSVAYSRRTAVVIGKAPSPTPARGAEFQHFAETLGGPISCPRITSRFAINARPARPRSGRNALGDAFVPLGRSAGDRGHLAHGGRERVHAIVLRDDNGRSGGIPARPLRARAGFPCRRGKAAPYTPCAIAMSECLSGLEGGRNPCRRRDNRAHRR